VNHPLSTNPFTFPTNFPIANGVVTTSMRRIEALGRRAVALQIDVAESAGFEAFAQRVQDVLAATWQRSSFDQLVNNAGVGVHAPFAETTEAQFDRLVAVHLKGTFFLTQKLLPLIADRGQIVNISSGLARFSFPGYAAYAAMKGGISLGSRWITGQRIEASGGMML
jgi:NAD(P)-dependent dehydrogenase (short-subunit alcohol dehydrogenase family)